MSKAGVLDFGYSYIQASDADINNRQNVPGVSANGNVVGTYKAFVNVLGVQYQHTF
jgi:long-subunit fatty acid transport protein